MRTTFTVALLLLAGAPFLGQTAQGQLYSSLGLGVVSPQGDFGDYYDMGVTFRGQAGISILSILDAHLQTGVTSFVLSDDYEGSDGEDANVYHAGVGARVGLGFIFVGGNAAYFFGDGESDLGLFPEVGVKIWRLEAVADYRIDGDENWGAVRLAWRF
jgi:hypothetical protein